MPKIERLAEEKIKAEQLKLEKRLAEQNKKASLADLTASTDEIPASISLVNPKSAT